jgi:uncharacterized protein YbjT (DUF2867 family)
MTLSGKRVLVTGATGFLGGALTKRLAAEGARVRALARHPERDRFIRDIDRVEIVTAQRPAFGNRICDPLSQVSHGQST